MMDVSTRWRELCCERDLPQSSIALLVLAEAVDNVAVSLNKLGNNDACTPMGGLEALGLVLKEGMSEMATAMSEIGEIR